MVQEHWELDFIVSYIAMAVGLGNIWRFPFIAYENGGGAFLVAYLIVVCILGIPIYFFEVAIGQFSGKGSFKLFNALAPAFGGIGVVQTLCTIVVSSYYSPLLAIVLYYFVKSFNMPLPWSVCYPKHLEICLDPINSTDKDNMTSSTELFFIKYVLNEPSNLDYGIGVPNPKLAFALLVTWFGVFFVLTKSERISGSFHYFFCLCPYFILFIMLGIALAQKGSAKGLEYFFNPKWSQLLHFKVWFNAICQSFYSMGFGFGTLTLLSSNNNFNHDISWVASAIPAIDTCISLLCGMIAFSILGNMAERLNSEVDQVIRSGGISMLYIVYPETLSKLACAPFVMAVICFTMIFTLGFGCLVAMQRVFNDQVRDYMKIEYWEAAVLSSVIGFALGLCYITRGGMYIVQLVDHFGIAMLIYVLVLFEVLCVVYGYGLRSFCWDIEYMTTRKVNVCYRIVWSLILPIILIVVFVGYLIELSQGIKMKEIEYPLTVLLYGWLMFFVGLVILPTTVLFHLYQRKEAGCPNMCENIFNHDSWSPARQLDKSEWKASRRLQEKDDNCIVDFLKALIRR